MILNPRRPAVGPTDSRQNSSPSESASTHPARVGWLPDVYISRAPTSAAGGAPRRPTFPISRSESTAALAHRVMCGHLSLSHRAPAATSRRFSRESQCTDATSADACMRTATRSDIRAMFSSADVKRAASRSPFTVRSSGDTEETNDGHLSRQEGCLLDGRVGVLPTRMEYPFYRCLITSVPLSVRLPRRPNTTTTTHLTDSTKQLTPCSSGLASH